jgi:aspartate/tyrosine/aromatic aminotransferase
MLWATRRECLTPVSRLRDQHSIYIVKGGRISVAGISSQNLPYLVDAIAGVLG